MKYTIKKFFFSYTFTNFKTQSLVENYTMQQIYKIITNNIITNSFFYALSSNNCIISLNSCTYPLINQRNPHA